MNANDRIEEVVHELYWEHDVNCARTALACLSDLHHTEVASQTLDAAIGLHGAGGYGAQCGLVEGALMFIGIYFSGRGKSAGETAALCRRYADEFTKRFGSLRCCELRPGGFTEDDPPHRCEELTCAAIAFAHGFIKKMDIGPKE